MITTTPPRARTVRNRGIVTAAAVTAAVLAVAGCSSSKTTSNGSSASAPVPTSTVSVESAADLSGVQALVKKAMASPTKILQTTPLNSKPDHKTYVYINNEDAGSADIAEGVKAGAEALGWDYKQLNFKTTDSSTLISAMNQALQYKPIAVSFSGPAEPIWASEIPKYQSAGAAIIPIVVGPLTQPVSKTVPVNIGDFTEGGVALGNWLAADSQQAGSALLFDLPVFPVLTEYITGAKQALAANCPKCKTTAVDGTLAQLSGGTLVPAIVTALKKDRSIKYVVASDLYFVSSLSSALKTAGITDVKIVGGEPEPSDLQIIKSGGTEKAGALIANQVLGWMAVDSAARLSENMTIPDGDGGAAQQLLTQGNVTSTNLSDYVLPTDYPAQFKALWKVG